MRITAGKGAAQHLAMLIISLSFAAPAAGCGGGKTEAQENFERIMKQNDRIIKEAESAGRLDMEGLITNFNESLRYSTIFHDSSTNSELHKWIIEALNVLETIREDRAAPPEGKIAAVKQVCLKCHERFTK